MEQPAQPIHNRDTNGFRKLIRQQLLFLIHVAECLEYDPGNQLPCHFPHCRMLKNVLIHMTVCQEGKFCRIPHCSSSRQILTHYENCNKSACPVCLPIRKPISRRVLNVHQVRANQPNPVLFYQPNPVLFYQPNPLETDVRTEEKFKNNETQMLNNPMADLDIKYLGEGPVDTDHDFGNIENVQNIKVEEVFVDSSPIKNEPLSPEGAESGITDDFFLIKDEPLSPGEAVYWSTHDSLSIKEEPSSPGEAFNSLTDASSTIQETAGNQSVLIQAGFPDISLPSGSVQKAGPETSTQQEFGIYPFQETVQLKMLQTPPVQGMKRWHQSFSSDLRNQSVHKLVQAILPPSIEPTVELDKRIMPLFTYAREVENKLYDAAGSETEYYHLLGQKICDIQERLKERRLRRLIIEAHMQNS